MVLLSTLVVCSPVSSAYAATSDMGDTQESVTVDVTFTDYSFNLNDLVADEYDGLDDVALGVSREAEQAPVSVKDLAKKLVADRFGANQFDSFDKIITHESNWNVRAVNTSSGPCGLGQALPCSKMKDKTPAGQVAWVVQYIADRYGTPNNAWKFWQSHHWY